MMAFFLQAKMPAETNLPALFRDWREDAMIFLRHDAPKIVLVLLGAFVLVRIVRAITGKLLSLEVRKLPPGLRVRQVQTVASVLNSVGVFAILFVAALTVLPLLGLNL